MCSFAELSATIGGGKAHLVHCPSSLWKPWGRALPALGSTAEEAAAAPVQLLNRKGRPLTHREQGGHKEAVEIHRARPPPRSKLPLSTAQTQRCVKRRGGEEELRLSVGGQGVRGTLKCHKAVGCPRTVGNDTCRQS